MDFLDLLWLKAKPASGFNSDFAYDCSNRLIYRWHHGKRDSGFGWEIGHIIARCEGGSDSFCNLQPEHWRTNLDKEAIRKRAQSHLSSTLSFLATGDSRFATLSGLASSPEEHPLPPERLSYGQAMDKLLRRSSFI